MKQSLNMKKKYNFFGKTTHRTHTHTHSHTQSACEFFIVQTTFSPRFLTLGWENTFCFLGGWACKIQAGRHGVIIPSVDTAGRQLELDGECTVKFDDVNLGTVDIRFENLHLEEAVKKKSDAHTQSTAANSTNKKIMC